MFTEQNAGVQQRLVEQMVDRKCGWKMGVVQPIARKQHIRGGALDILNDGEELGGSQGVLFKPCTTGKLPKQRAILLPIVCLPL